MFLNPWSLALSLCSLVALVLGAVAGRTAVRVLRFWEPGSDSNRQIRLENEIWLSSTLVAYGLGFQIITLILFVLAADQFCQVIVGAMCATGALLANPYGMPALLVKLVGIFFYGFWILIHQLDIRSEHYPLVRIKYLALLLLLPLLVLDASLQTLYIAGIKPGEMRLTPAVLADIYLGKIVKWNDKAIAALNPKLSLPDQAIAVVRRADGSGTTFIFTNYLSKVSPEWKQKVGEGTAVQWPVGLGGKGNEGVSAFVQRIPGAIGYVEYAYAKQNKMAHTLLQNAAGNYPLPDDTSFKAAAAHADWGKSAFYEILTNEPGKDSWPVTGATFILMHKVQGKPENAAEVLKFFDWAYTHGGKMALDMDYIPMPDSVVKLVKGAWKAQIKDAGGKALWN